MPRLSAQRKALVLGTDVRSLTAVIRSLGRRNVQVHIAGHPPNSPAARSRFVARSYTIPDFTDNDDQWLTAIAGLMRRERFDLVIACSDPFQIPLQRHRRELEPLGRIYLLPDEVFLTVNDKIAMNDLARSTGVRVPKEKVVCSLSETSELRQQFRLPIVLKPRFSFDLQNVGQRQTVSKAYSWQEFESTLSQMVPKGPVTVQENFVGRGIGLEFLLNAGRPLLEFQHERLHEPLLGGGSSYRQGVAIDPALREAALALLGQLRYTGVAMVEFKVNLQTGDWVFIEVNGRFWGSLPLAVASGADFPLALFEFLVDGRTNFPQKYRQGLCCRYWSGDYFWQIDNLRADRTDPTLMTSPLTRVLAETFVNFCTMRERSDMFSLDDPLPGLAELAQLASSIGRAVKRRVKSRWLHTYLIRRRTRDRARRAFKDAKSLLFVCKGNICRSAFAHYAAEQIFGAGKEVLSAGYYPETGRPSPADAVAAAAKFSVDLSGHRSVQLTEQLVRRADAIFVFDYANHERLHSDFKAIRGKLHVLGTLCPNGPVWIADPYGQKAGDFVETFERITQALRAGT